ncbi:MAG: hypothetical protein LBF51_03760 [Zoogloeaceae bacterium]|jgi:hypothetical protein|nr:hypothetical protein [Zoogloeaceae bacterium]
MASIRKYRDKWRAEIFVNGWRKSATFRVKRDAIAWAAEEEIRARSMGARRGQDVRRCTTVAEVLERYAREVSCVTLPGFPVDLRNTEFA